MAKYKTKKSSNKVKVHRLSYVLVMGVLILVSAFLFLEFWKGWREDRKDEDYQASISDFYRPPSPLPSATPGYLIRSEKIDTSVPRGGSVYRILYVTEAPNGQAVASSGLVFVPAGPPPPEGRKVVAWAHGTLGFGDACTPSRNMNEATKDMAGWLDAVMQRGYVLAATDYVGIGTPGEPYYLIGKSESNDVINSVRAAQNLPQAGAGNEYVAWGHSQGGHSALFTAIESQSYAPELKLMGVAAAAPAAELQPLFAQQYSKPVAWVIGPDVAASWPSVYSNLPLEGVLTKEATRHYDKLAHGCVQQQVAGLTLRAATKSQFFTGNPMQNPAWVKASTEQTPDVSKITVPMYIAQGLSDPVVLPNTTALLAQKACQAGKNIQLSWMANTSHIVIAVAGGQDIVAWMQDRFNGAAPPSSCNQPLPIQPAESS